MRCSKRICRGKHQGKGFIISCSKLSEISPTDQDVFVEVVSGESSLLAASKLSEISPIDQGVFVEVASGGASSLAASKLCCQRT